MQSIINNDLGCLWWNVFGMESFKIFKTKNLKLKVIFFSKIFRTKNLKSKVIWHVAYSNTNAKIFLKVKKNITTHIQTSSISITNTKDMNIKI